MDEFLSQWMTYIDEELMTVCTTKGNWGFALFENGAAPPPFGIPSESYFSWQLLPECTRYVKTVTSHRLKLPLSSQAEAPWFIIEFNLAHGLFRIQHSNIWSGATKESFQRMTSTEIPVHSAPGIREKFEQVHGIPLFLAEHWGTHPGVAPPILPPEKWLSTHILAVIEEFTPSSFSY